MASHSALYTKHMQFLPGSVLARLRARLYDPLRYWLARWFLATQTVSIGLNSYHYLVNWYNFTWMNERAIEIPFFIDCISGFNPKQILEVGNTLSHYFSSSHTVVDKYETARGVKNIDVLNFHPSKQYECIFAISTVEHIGWHEPEARAPKAIEAITHLRRLLSKTGTLVISFPIGVNPALDAALRSHSLAARELMFLRRTHWFNLWEESSYTAVRSLRYNTPYPNANAICIATFGPIARPQSKHRASAAVKKTR